jgi:hypothetical protein
MKLNNRLTGRRIAAAAVLASVITCGGLALAPAAFAAPTPAAFAAPTVASATTHSATHSAVVVPQTAATCTDWLGIHGYTVSTARATACHVAALERPNIHTAILLCTAALVATRVNASIATTACIVATIPG